MSGLTPSDNSFVENPVSFNKENILILRILLTKMDVDFTQRWRERKAFFLQRQDFFNPRQARSRKNSRQNSCRVDNQTPLLGQFSLSHDLLWNISAWWIIRRCRFGNGAAQKYDSECFRSGALQRLFASTAFRARRRFGVQCRKLFSCPRSRIAEDGRLRRNPHAWSDETPKTDVLGNVTFPGHIGTIFKSDNAIYLGRSAKSDEYLFADGSVLSNRSFSKLVNNESGWSYMARKFELYGAIDCPKTAVGRREWGFYWRGRLTRKQRNSGKLRYAWSLHSKIVLPKSLPYVRLRLGDVQPRLLNPAFSDQWLL